MSRDANTAPLIYDIGMYNGDDTAFYLRKGFRVIGVEANPLHVERARAAFQQEIAAGRLIIYSVALAAAEGTATLLVHEHDDWTRVAADRDYRFSEGNFREITVPAKRFAELYARHETPYYVKLDIEGSEILAIHDMFASKRYPPYLSFEANTDLDSLLTLCSAHGYSRFNIVPQMAKCDWQLPDPPLEGSYVQARFTGYMSGPFGREVPGAWLTLDQVRQAFRDWQQAAERGEEDALGEWHDVHAYREPDGHGLGWTAIARRLRHLFRRAAK